MSDDALIERVARAICVEDTVGLSLDEVTPTEREHYSKLATAALAAGGGERWLPIESAPKDGTEILVAHRDNPSFLQIVSWTTDYGAPYRWQAPDDPRYHEDAFAFWQPLPAPPALNEQEG